MPVPKWLLKIRERLVKPAPKKMQYWILRGRENDPFFAHIYVVKVLDVRDGWVRYRKYSGELDSMKVKTFVSIFRYQEDDEE